MEQGKKVKARSPKDTKSRILGLLCATASYNCQQSNSELSVGRERRKGDVEKGLWADTCSAMYGFAPESEVYFKKSSYK